MFDAHVHAAPDVLPRFADDTDTVSAYEAAGYDGVVLKAHYDCTAGRAHAAGRGRAITVYGGLALNAQTGGVNASAVAAALDQGARVIWMPTADAAAQQAAGLPRLCGLHERLPGHTYSIPPRDFSAEQAVRDVLDLIAQADAVLATGHLGAKEVRWLIGAAREHGVGRVLLTHPSYTVPAMPARLAAELAETGAHVEVTAYQLLHQAGASAETLAAFVRAVGYQRLVLSSDAGQPDSPSPPEALALLVDTLAGQGLDAGALHAAASDLPHALIAP
ncbi:MAG: DUF6282 family protein [Actinocrinis sp.]